MVDYQSFGAVGGDADLVLGDRYSDVSENYALNPADLTRLNAPPTATPFAKRSSMSPTTTLPFSSQLVQPNHRHALTSSEPTADPLLLYLDPALVGDATAAPAMSNRQGSDAGDRPISRATTLSTKTSSSGRSNPEARSKSTTPLTVHSPGEPIEPSPQPPKKRTRTAKPKSVTVKVESKEDDKRDQFLERNRVAASKCRKKKKVWMTELEEAKQVATQQHIQLRSEYNCLLNEVGELKNMIMSHASCNNSNIDKWIENEAKRFVESTNRRLERAGYGPRQSQSPGRHHPSRTLSIPSLHGSDQSGMDEATGLLSENGTNAGLTASSQAPGSSVMAKFTDQELEMSDFKMDSTDAEYHMPLSMFLSATDEVRA